MKTSFGVMAGMLAALTSVADARNISIDTPSYFPPPATPGPGFAFPFLRSDSASLSITEPDSAFVYELTVTPGTKRTHSAAGTSLGAGIPSLPASNCSSLYYTGLAYPTNPTYICVAYMLNWGPAPNQPPDSTNPIESQVMVYQFDNAKAIAAGNCAVGACGSALSLPQPDGSVVVIDDPEDVLEVDFNYLAAECKKTTASLTLNHKTYTYAGKDLCAANNVFIFYRNGGEAILLARPAGWNLDVAGRSEPGQSPSR